MAGNVYNPNAPQTMGEEWFADLWGTWDLQSGPWAQAFRSRSAETINQIKAMIDPADDSINGLLLAEIFPTGSEIPTGTVTSVAYQPNGDIAIGAWLNQAGSGVNIFQSIDEGVDTVNTADYAKVPPLTPASNYDIRFGSAAFSATARVLNVKIRIVGSSSTPTLNSGVVSVLLLHRPSSTTYNLNKDAGGLHTLFLQGAIPTLTFDLGEINPKTQLPWTPADIIGFDGGTNVWALRLQSYGTASGEFRAYAAEVDVTYQTVENRVAAASYLKPAAPVAAGVQTLNNFVALPGAGASWAKPISGDFTILFRKPSYTFASWTSHISMLWQSSQIAGAEVNCVVPGVVSALPSLDSYGQVTACDFGSSTAPRTLALLLMTSAPAVSQDSLPYYLTGDTTHLVDISNTSTIKQQFTPTASATFTVIKLLLSPGAATQSLIVKIKRNSDNVQFGTTATLTVASVTAQAADANGFRLATVTLGAGGALINGTQYYIELTSADTHAAGTGWRTIILGDAGLAGRLATMGGSTDIATVAGSAKTDFDMPVAVSQIVAVPANFAAAVQVLSNNVNAPTQDCVPKGIQAISLTWTPTALGAFWSRYEIQRTEDNGFTWATIAYITSAEATAAFTDLEATRGKSVQYQIRTLRTDGVYSAWSASTAGRTLQALGCEMIFVSNEQPTLRCAFDIDPERSFEFLAASRDSFMEIYGSDYAVAFSESEDPGLRLGALLAVNFRQQPTIDDVSIFNPVRNIARAGTSYVCVLDNVGNRYFAHLQVSKGSWTEPGFVYRAEILITEIAGSPSIASG